MSDLNFIKIHTKQYFVVVVTPSNPTYILRTMTIIFVLQWKHVIIIRIVTSLEIFAEEAWKCCLPLSVVKNCIVLVENWIPHCCMCTTSTQGHFRWQAHSAFSHWTQKYRKKKTAWNTFDSYAILWRTINEGQSEKHWNDVFRLRMSRSTILSLLHINGHTQALAASKRKAISANNYRVTKSWLWQHLDCV